MDTNSIIGQLKDLSSASGNRDETLKEAVRLIHASNPRYNWTGIYLLEGDTLVLHNYIGKPTEHTHIQVGVGVCGTAVAETRDINVEDVTKLDNYLACSLETRAEIVVLIKDSEKIYGQIDIDSDTPGAFTDHDEQFLGKIADHLATILGV
ncbi:MAG TPA: GAF domain-containing protein [Blastocatellia bacterium]|nr:GAF domain-containing protein [Blastocatellia bacterium]